MKPTEKDVEKLKTYAAGKNYRVGWFDGTGIVVKRGERDSKMKIKAKYFNRDIVIVDFVSVYEKAIKVIYVDQDGNIGACYLNSSDLKVVDREYLPVGESKIAKWCDMVERNEKWMG